MSSIFLFIAGVTLIYFGKESLWNANKGVKFVRKIGFPLTVPIRIDSKTSKLFAQITHSMMILLGLILVIVSLI